MVDELSALTAYSDTSVKKEADRLLGEILAQGRALGVVVVACVQDPRKEVASLRNLFTQVITLRLQSASESIMVLGDLASRAPAHTLRRGHPGMDWVIDAASRTDRVRADYWPDDLIRQAASVWPTRVYVSLEPVRIFLTCGAESTVKTEVSRRWLRGGASSPGVAGACRTLLAPERTRAVL
ncbi:hypothetical protein [Austwickia chelonae]|uniref:FtsK domain-containing protein n=1 Tax=Austwickia chelonae NBRC 105200 TaxID=1184607 RepID=K6V4G4_9MICO|nr:hypothetical protein [Austwickia chelonae]GAB77003.1 hypothetical protein AUCHE_04_00440 [Austwickia chelonae NBRC 105200]